MDPNETLEAIRDLVHHSKAYTPRGLNWDDSATLVGLIESLDESAERGFLPADWAQR